MDTLLVFHGQNQIWSGYTPSLSVSPPAVSLKADGTSLIVNRNIVTVDVADASQTWGLAKSQTWIIITGASYQGDDTFTITAERNASGVSRSGTVTVSSSGCTSVVINVSQAA